YVRGYSRRAMGIKPERGTWVHELLAAYYFALKHNHKNPMQVAEIAHQDYKEGHWDRLFEEEQEALGDLPTEAWNIFERYVRRYEEADKRFKKIVMVEKYFHVPVSWLPVPLGIKCDLVVIDDLNWMW